MLLNTPVCDFGWKAPDFALPDLNGDLVRRDDLLSEQGLLVMFICNHCPYVQAIAERLAGDMATLQGEGIGVAAIMSNDYRLVPADSPSRMRAFAKQHRFTFPYLLDETQAVGQAYGALCTPDFFGFNGRGELQYRGRLDDALRGSPVGRTPELLLAMRQIAATGEGPREQTASIGCSIKWTHR